MSHRVVVEMRHDLPIDILSRLKRHGWTEQCPDRDRWWFIRGSSSALHYTQILIIWWNRGYIEVENLL